MINKNPFAHFSQEIEPFESKAHDLQFGFKSLHSLQNPKLVSVQSINFKMNKLIYFSSNFNDF